MGKRTCSEEECEKDVFSLQLCVTHYHRAYRAGALPGDRSGFHRLANINLDLATADCAVCGPSVQIRLRKGRGRGHECFAKRVEHRATSADDRRLRKYGLTGEQFRQMVEEQQGKCLICDQKPRETLAVDHCHQTGRIRGLLCTPCNLAIGSLRDSPDAAFRASIYLLTR